MDTTTREHSYDGNCTLKVINSSDERAFAALYKDYWDRLLHFGSRYLNDVDSCEEIVQELFIQLHTRKLPLQVNKSVSSYLYGAMRNRIYNYIRKQAVYKRHVQNASLHHGSFQNNVEHMISLKELQTQVNKILNSVPERYREVYLLHENGRLPVRQIALILNRPFDTVDKQLRKVQRELKMRLKHYSLNT